MPGRTAARNSAYGIAFSVNPSGYFGGTDDSWTSSGPKVKCAAREEEPARIPRRGISEPDLPRPPSSLNTSSTRGNETTPENIREFNAREILGGFYHESVRPGVLWLHGPVRFPAWIEAAHECRGPGCPVRRVGALHNRPHPCERPIRTGSVREPGEQPSTTAGTAGRHSVSATLRLERPRRADRWRLPRSGRRHHCVRPRPSASTMASSAATPPMQAYPKTRPVRAACSR